MDEKMSHAYIQDEMNRASRRVLKSHAYPIGQQCFDSENEPADNYFPIRFYDWHHPLRTVVAVQN